MEGKGGAGAFRTRAVRIPEGIPTYSEVPSIARGRNYAGSERKTARVRGGGQRSGFRGRGSGSEGLPRRDRGPECGDGEVLTSEFRLLTSERKQVPVGRSGGSGRPTGALSPSASPDTSERRRRLADVESAGLARCGSGAARSVRRIVIVVSAPGARWSPMPARVRNPAHSPRSPGRTASIVPNRELGRPNAEVVAAVHV